MATRAKALRSKGVEVVQGNLDDAASLKSALQGAWGVFAVQNSWEAGVEGEETQDKVAHRGNRSIAEVPVARDHAAGVLHGESAVALVPSR